MAEAAKAREIKRSTRLRETRRPAPPSEGNAETSKKEKKTTNGAFKGRRLKGGSNDSNARVADND